MAASRLDDEAQRVLLALREVQPEDAETNLRLARLQARASDATRRYCQNALAGLWRPKQVGERRRVRIELRTVIDVQGDGDNYDEAGLVQAAGMRFYQIPMTTHAPPTPGRSRK